VHLKITVPLAAGVEEFDFAREGWVETLMV
jgi:hypothetical protein